MTHQQNSFSIAFTALDWQNEGEVHFRYKLEPFNPDWVVAASGENVARFVNVPPGAYRFTVQASSRAGAWSREDASVRIVITPAFWQTIWFKALSLLTFAGLLYFFTSFVYKTRYRLRLAFAEKAVEAERLRTRIAQDIHDEVGGSLTKISLSAQVAARLPDLSEGELKSRLEKLGADARQAAGHLREIVFAINPDFDRFSEMQAYFRETAREFWSESAVETHFEFDKSEHDPLVPPDVKRQLLLIFKEAQNNVAKHAAARGVWLQFQLNAENNYLLEVRDDGRGFLPSKKNGFTQGLGGMKKRAQSIGAVLSVQSEPEKGAMVSVTGRF